MAKLDYLGLLPFDDKRQRGPAAPKDKKQPKRLSRQRKERKADDAEYLRIVDLFIHQQPSCAYCGATTQLTGDHIVAGTAGRAASLLHFDTINVACLDCNCNKSISRAVKAACKLIVCIRTIERLQHRNFSDQENRQILKLLRTRKAGHSR